MSLSLTEEDIPSASLRGRGPDDVSLVDLRRWLVCRGAHKGGMKPELINRSVILIFLNIFWDHTKGC